MISWLKLKSTSQTPYESVAKNTFSRRNEFVDCLRDLYLLSPKEVLLNRIENVEKDITYSTKIYLNPTRTNNKTLTLNYKTKDYIKTLMKTIGLIDKCSRIIHSNSKLNADYLMNELVDVVYLLQELDSSLRKGVPLDHPTIIDAVLMVLQLLEEKLNVYYQLSTESLSREIEIAKQLRLEYQARKEFFHLINDRQVETDKNPNQ